MASLPIHTRDGGTAGNYEIAPEDLAANISRQLLHDAVVMYQANQRLGTHRTRRRSDVAGSGKKMYRQKGTGNARAGHKRSGIRRGGGHIFAKRPRDYSYRLPRKALQAATRMALASKVADEQLVLVDSLEMDAPKTKDAAALLKAVGVAGQTTLVITEEHSVNTYKSFRNIPGVEVLPLSDLNAWSVLKPSCVVATPGGLDRLKEAAAAKSKAGAAAE